MLKEKNEIKQTKPVKFSNWQVVKEMLAFEFKDLALKFKNGGWKGAVIGTSAVGLGIGLTGCVTTEKPPVVQYQEVEINNIDSLSEIKNLLGNNFVLSEKVEDAVKAEFGEDAIITVASENEDGSGNILVVVDVDGVKVATTSLNILASDFNARIFASNTYTKEGNKLSYYQNQEPKEEDLQGKYTYEDASGNLTVVDSSNIDEKVLNAFEDLTLEDTGLRAEISPNDEEIFSQLLGRIISEDITIFMPTIDYQYAGENTKVTLAYNQGSDIIKTVLSFEGNLLSSGSFDIENAIQQFKENSVTKTTKTEDYAKYADYTAIISNGNKSFVVKYIDDENGSEQGQEETITFNSWDEVFNVFGEENSDLVKNKLNEILTEKLLNEQNIKSMFGNDMTLEDLTNGKIEILKWSFGLTDNEISSVQVLAQRKEYPSQEKNWVRSAQFNLQKNVSLETIKGKKNFDKIVEGDYILRYGNIYLDFSDFSEKLVLDNRKQINEFIETSIKIEETMTDEEKAEQQEKLNIFNLLMPYAVSKNTLYSKFTVSYRSGMNNSIDFTLYAFNESTLNYERWSFSFKEDSNYENVIELIQKGINDKTFDFYEVESKQMIYGNIIFNVGNGNQNVIEISPYSQQSVSEKQ